MCDCFWTACDICGKGYIPVHILDFRTRRDNVVALCEKHLKSGADCVVYALGKDEEESWGEGERVGFRLVDRTNRAVDYSASPKERAMGLKSPKWWEIATPNAFRYELVGYLTTDRSGRSRWWKLKGMES